MNDLSTGDSVVFMPTAWLGSSTQLFAIGYIMIDDLSRLVPWMLCFGYFSNMLWSMVALSQLFGGPERSWYTAGLFHLIASTGFWCSWIRPSAWPNSCRMTRSASWSFTPGVSQPKFIVG